MSGWCECQCHPTGEYADLDACWCDCEREMTKTAELILNPKKEERK